MTHLRSFAQHLRLFASDEAGQDLVEYALVAGLIGLGVTAAMSNLSGTIGRVFSSLGSRMTSNV